MGRACGRHPWPWSLHCTHLTTQYYHVVTEPWLAMLSSPPPWPSPLRYLAMPIPQGTPSYLWRSVLRPPKSSHCWIIDLLRLYFLLYPAFRLITTHPHNFIAFLWNPSMATMVCEYLSKYCAICLAMPILALHLFFPSAPCCSILSVAFSMQHVQAQAGPAV